MQEYYERAWGSSVCTKSLLHMMIGLFGALGTYCSTERRISVPWVPMRASRGRPLSIE
jgi:hypothetical protein